MFWSDWRLQNSLLSGPLRRGGCRTERSALGRSQKPLEALPLSTQLVEGQQWWTWEGIIFKAAKNTPNLPKIHSRPDPALGSFMDTVSLLTITHVLSTDFQLRKQKLRGAK